MTYNKPSRQRIIETADRNTNSSTSSGINIENGRSRPADGRYCAACGHQNPEELATCLNCLGPLGTSCPNCNQPISAGSKFCGQCGTPLSGGPPAAVISPRSNGTSPNIRSRLPTALAEKINAASVKSAGERREVTVLFLDVTNFTAASHQLDGEDVYLFIDEAMSLLVEVIHKYEGTVDKFTGDGLMALFGVPAAHENDPERAVRAALEMQSVLEPLQKRIRQGYGFDFQARIGLNTGAAIAGNLGNDFHQEYTVIGDTVNLASRLEVAAEPGTILISEATYQRTGPLFEFRTLPPFTVKGMPDPIRAYRPLKLLEKAGRVRGVAGLQVPMVGRTQDLSRLQQALEQVRQDGQRRMAVISGEAGLGKSRLSSEFQRSLAQSESQVYQGSCLDYARATPLSVVIDLLRNMLQLSGAASNDLQQKTLVAQLEQIGLANDDVLPYLTHVLGLEQVDPRLEAQLRLLDAEMLQRQTHAALRQFLLATARREPTVLIFEDLHWVDPASRDFLEYFIQTSSHVPLLLVLVSRPAERETVLLPLLAAAQKEPERFVEVQLRALAAEEAQILIDQLIPENSVEARALKKQIASRAAGNPFYIEEIIRMLIDQGGLVGSAAAKSWQVTPQAGAVIKAVPGTVQGLILARVDRLPEQVRQTLQKAAVLGTSFPVSLLGRLSEISPEALAQHLEALETRQFLSTTSFRSEAGYVFNHALTREAVYQILLKRERRKIHARAAQAIEHSSLWPPEEQVEALAHHYAESHKPSKAIPYLITAAENTTRRCAYEISGRHYQRAMSLLPDQPPGQSCEFFQVRLGLGTSLKYLGQLGEAGQLLSATLTLLRKASPAAESATLGPILIEFLHQLADVRQREGVYAEASAYLEEGLQLLGETAPQQQPQIWRSLVERLAWIRFRQGELTEAFNLASSATAGSSGSNEAEPIVLAKLCNTLGGLSWQRGQLDKAVDYVERSLQLYEQLGYAWGQATAYGNLGVLYDILGNWPRAIEYHQQAYMLFEAMGHLEGQARSLDNLGFLYMIKGDHKAAGQEMKASLLLRQRLGESYGIAQSQVNLAQLALIQSRFEQAETYAESALTLADTIGSPEVQVEARWILALVQAENDSLPPGLETAKQALDMAQAAGQTEKEVDCLRVLGVLRARAGETSEAEILFGRAIELSLAQNDPYRQGQALLELGRMYQSLAQTDHSVPEKWRAKALSTLSEAAGQFERLGAAYDLRQAQFALNQVQTD